MKFINHFFIFIFAFCLSMAAVAYCINQTLLKADFVTAQLDKSGIYSDLATQLPTQLVKDPAQADVKSALGRTITADFLKTNIDPYIRQLIAAYAKGNTIPTLDLSSAVTSAQNLGASLTPDQARELAEKLTIKPSSQTAGQPNSGTTWYKRIANSQWIFALIALAAGIMVVLTAPHHHLKSLSRGFIYAGIWLGIWFAVFHFIPSIAAHQLKNLGENPLTGSANNLVALAAAGVAKQILIAMIATGVIGIGLWLLSHFVPHIHHGKDGDKRTPLPSLFHKA